MTMDILRKELNAIYDAQNLSIENLDYSVLSEYKQKVETAAEVSSGCMVITDAAADRCYIYGGRLACLLGLNDTVPFVSEMDSSDEDIIYIRMHPEDLADKRMLEYEFFKFVDALPDNQKLDYRATCRFRIKQRNGDYVYVDNSTRIARLSPHCKMWLILCTYDLSHTQEVTSGIGASIINGTTGQIHPVEFSERRSHILTEREKEILNLIKQGKLSKQIAGTLGISIHTVNRHRQNILEKLSVGNSVEAIMAATLMKLF